MIKLKKGLDLPIEGSPEQKAYEANKVSKYAVIGDDVVGMKPSMSVKVGEQVKVGQVLFSDKKTPGVLYTSPIAGEVVEINRGERRAFQSVVIKKSGEDHVEFENFQQKSPSNYSEKEIKNLLIESGMWPSLRARPYSKVANPETRPSSIFITAIDTHPLAMDPKIFISEFEKDFVTGVKVLSKLADKTFVCTDKDFSFDIPTENNIKTEKFDGPHPAGLVGTHIHYLDPVGEKKFVWHTNYQEVVAIGKLFSTGKLFTQRWVSIAGPIANRPRIVKTQVGASLDQLTDGEIKPVDKARVISGSVFGGRHAQGPFAFLGRFHHSVSLLEEGDHREFLGWHSPGFNKFSIKNIYISKLMDKNFGFTTDSNGSLRALVPIGSYEKVMPLDIIPTFLLRYIMSNNNEMCVKLGALELDEEDLALCTFVDPSKNDFGPKLREKLTIIEKEG